MTRTAMVSMPHEIPPKTRTEVVKEFQYVQFGLQVTKASWFQ